MNVWSRRSVLAALGATAGAGALAGCAGVAGGGGGGGSDVVRYAFWGNDRRFDNYQKAFDRMAEEMPEVKVELEFAEQTPYRERMTTQMAARSVPNIFWVALVDVMTYHANGLYRRLDDLDSLDLSDFSEADLQDFQINGELNTLPFAIQVPTIRYNRTFADEDGVSIPSDWDWDDLAELARDYTENNPDGRRALSYRPDHSLSVLNWLRQHDEQLWTEDGQVGFSADNLASWIDWWEKLRKAGATTSISEQDGVQASWTEIGDQVLMHFGSGNHAIDEGDMFPDYEFGLAEQPADPGAPEGFRFIFTQRMAVYSGTADGSLSDTGTVLGYCINNADMIRDVGLTLGTPTNPRVAEECREFATDIGREILDFDRAAREAPRDPLYETPPGASEWNALLRRELENVVHQGANVSEVAQRVIDEVQRGIDRAR